MPFPSLRSAETCYGKQLSAKAKNKRWTWDCDAWLNETKGCVPTVVSEGKSKKALCGPFRAVPPSKRIYYEGARGGLYFYADRDKKLKIYVPSNAKTYVKRHFQVVRV